MGNGKVFNDEVDRLLEAGASALDDLELLAAVMPRSCSAASLEVLRGLLMEHGGLEGLQGFDDRALARQGLGRRQRASLLAALELGRRSTVDVDGRPHLNRPARIVDYLGRRFHRIDQEVVGALYFDERRRLLGMRDHFHGNRYMAAVEPAIFFSTALRLRASALVVFHTHPGGDPRPSAADRAMTERLDHGARILGLRLLDHIILADGGRWYSFESYLELCKP